MTSNEGLAATMSWHVTLNIVAFGADILVRCVGEQEYIFFYFLLPIQEYMNRKMKEMAAKQHQEKVAQLEAKAAPLKVLKVEMAKAREVSACSYPVLPLYLDSFVLHCPAFIRTLS